MMGDQNTGQIPENDRPVLGPAEVQGLEQLWDAIQSVQASRYYKVGLLYRAWQTSKRRAFGRLLRWALGRFVGRPIPLVSPELVADPLVDLGRPRGYRTQFPSEDELAAELNALPSEAPLFVFPLPNCPWGFLFQRPQQLARALARAGCLVLYCTSGESGRPDCHVRGLYPVEGNLLLLNDAHECQVLRKLKRPLVLWQYWPQQSGFSKVVSERSALVYDCLDHLHCFAQYFGIGRDHRKTLKEADVVLVSSAELEEGVRRWRPDCLRVPNGVCWEDFSDPKPQDWPELRELRSRSEVLIGYYGAIAEWLDYDLLRACARARPGWRFLLVGQVYPNILERERLGAIPNITVWSRVHYRRLPWLLANWDVATVPFKINEITRAVSPVKLFEYMAGGKPVVTTDLPECRRYPPVQIARGPSEFIAQCERALQLGREPAHAAQLRALARENTWDARVRIALDALREKRSLSL